MAPLQFKLSAINRHKWPRKIANNLFFSFMALFFAALLLGGIIFYKYGILPQRKVPVISENIIKFQEDVYKEVLRAWQDREEGFKAAAIKEYPDLFK